MSGRRGAISEATRISLVAVAGLASALAVLFLSRAVEVHQLVASGGRGPSAVLIAEDFGIDAVDPDATGYDGQQTYAIARNFPDLDTAAEHTDSARYRMLRILPAALVWPLPRGTPTVLGLLAVNLVGFGLAARACARILERQGGSPAMGALAAAPLLVGVLATTTEPIAVGLAMAAIDLLLDGRHRAAVMAFVLAALSRETMALVAGLAGAGLVVEHRWKAAPVLPLYALPGLVIGGWYLVLGELVGGDLPTRFELLGFTEVDAVPAFVSAIVAFLGGLGAYVWRGVLPLALPSVAFTAWMLVYTVDILQPLALLRVNALSIVVGLLAAGWLLERHRSTRQAFG